MAYRVYTDTSVIGGCEDEEFRAYSKRLMAAFARRWHVGTYFGRRQGVAK